MKRGWIPLIIAILTMVALCGCAGTSQTKPAARYGPPPENVDVSYFYDALSPYGDWIWDDTYGWVWSPYAKPVDWRPYTDGEWIWTDYGWTWVSDEDWGWGPYHYGRWYDHSTNGWCWVPGQEWAPAWVAWREGDGWVGWAPLPPEVVWRAGMGFDHRDWDDLPGVRHYWWSFCQERDLPGPEVQRRLAPRHRAIILVMETRNVTNYTFVDSRVVNRSLDVDRFRQAYGRDIPAHRIADLSAAPAHHGRQIEQETLYAFRPRLRDAPAGRTPQVVRTARAAPTPAVTPATPPATARTPQAERIVRDQQRREALDLERRQAANRKHLEQEQRQETGQPPPGVSPNELHRKHEEERRALDAQTARDQRVLRARQEQQQSEGKAPAAKATPARNRKPVAGERNARGDRSR